MTQKFNVNNFYWKMMDFPSLLTRNSIGLSQFPTESFFITLLLLVWSYTTWFHCNILLLHLPSMIPSISYQNRLQFKALLKLPGLKSTRQVYHLVEIFSNLRKTHGLNEILMMESNSNSDMIGLFLLVKVLLYMNSNWLNFTYSIQLIFFLKERCKYKD